MSHLFGGSARNHLKLWARDFHRRLPANDDDAAPDRRDGEAFSSKRKEIFSHPLV